MNAETFVQHLKSAMPDRADLEDYGLDEDEIRQIRGALQAHRRGTDGAPATEIERLVSEFDCTRVEVGAVRFDDRATAHRFGTAFGRCEADPLVVTRGGSVVMVDHADPGGRRVSCASDSERFLDALARFVSIQHDRGEWRGRPDEAAESCALAAGGEQHTEFYRILCSFLA